jgi:hypothetical protein
LSLCLEREGLVFGTPECDKRVQVIHDEICKRDQGQPSTRIG